MTWGLLLAMAALLSSACSPTPEEAATDTPRGQAVEVREGLASYYAKWFDGRRTASGERFDNDEMMAAHPTYPFGTILRVTNLDNGKAVTVRVVDRGPAKREQRRGVIIDLSRAAADELDFIEDGRTRVRVERVRRRA